MHPHSVEFMQITLLPVVGPVFLPPSYSLIQIHKAFLKNKPHNKQKKILAATEKIENVLQ